MLTSIATLLLVLSVYCYICVVIYVNRYSHPSPGVFGVLFAQRI